MLTFLISGDLQAQPTPYAEYFEEAYQTYPTVPHGLLESVAWTNTRIRHLTPTESCQGLPLYYGVMGLVRDGKGYFQNSLKTISQLSGYSEEEIMTSPRINILAYAKAYSLLQVNKRMTSRTVESHRPILTELSEIPTESDETGRFAFDQQYYMVLKEMEAPHYNSQFRTRRTFDYEQVFGADNYRVLSAPRVTVSNERIRNADGNAYTAPGARGSSCTANTQKANYFGAIWNPANSTNYSSGRGGSDVEFVTVHTIQGSYASAIAWFRNSRANVSAHYIIRASDGQITQMVCENDKAWHVKTDNAQAIGIEHEGFIDDGGAWYTNEMYESSAALVRDICQRYDINPLQTYGGPSTSGVNTLTNTCYKVKGHQHFRGNNHIDPGPYWDWDRYYRLINPLPQPEIFTSRRGELTDPGGRNGNYSDQDRKTYLIRPEGATSIELTFDQIDLEGTTTKPYDYLDIYDGTDENGRLIGRYTGKVNPGTLLANSGSVYIEFRTDCQVNHAGFRLKYKARGGDVACEAPSSLLATNLFAMGTTLTWQGPTQDYVVLLTRRGSGQITRYLVREPQLVVTGLKANAVYQWQVQSVCGSDSSAIAGASFVTPNLMGRGQAQFFTVKSFQGQFNDSGGLTAGYGNEENYGYRILAPNGGRIEITFTEFETEEELDALSIYDGRSFNDRLIGTFSGETSPGRIRSTGPELLLHFKSDRSTNGAGWKASWRVIGGSTTPTPAPNPPVDPTPTPAPPTDPTPAPPTDPDPGPGPGPVNPPPLMNLGPFTLNLTYPSSAPTTSPTLNVSYPGDFTLRFSDRDRSGRGFANRFVNFAEKGTNGWRSRPQSGFFYDDFDLGLQPHWQAISGQWVVSDKRLVQTDMTHTNTNLSADLQQTGNEVYVYHWQARMSGPSTNKRHGIHFFASHPEQEDRGTSYFVWIRDGASEDRVEIYKTVNNQFDRKAVRTVQLPAGEVVDFKAIYNPRKGRIEVYVNNDFSGAWVDPYPLTRGKGISLRTGACQLELDNLIVYHNRGSSVQVEVGGSLDPLSGNKEFLVNSLVVDRRINWSKVGQAQSRFGDAPTPQPDPTPPTGGGTSTPDPAPPVTTPDPEPTPPPSTAPVVTEIPGTLSSEVRWNPGGTQYYLAGYQSGSEWTANGNLGFALDDFSRLRPGWRQATGSWQIRYATLQQTNPIEGNSNIYLPVRQTASQAYAYRFRARLLTAGENKRFGFHFLASNGASSNRGNSYLVWFRYSDSGADKVELYRASGNQMPDINAEAIIRLETLDWYEVTILADPATSTISVWLNNYPVLTWRDPNGLHQGGSAISFRTGNAQVQFDNLKVFQGVPENGAVLSGGSQNTPFPNRSNGTTPTGRVYLLQRSSRGWQSETQKNLLIR